MTGLGFEITSLYTALWIMYSIAVKRMANMMTEKNLWIARGWEDNKPVSSRVQVYTKISDALIRVTPFISLPK